jgi:hypothetical protein
LKRERRFERRIREKERRGFDIVSGSYVDGESVSMARTKEGRGRSMVGSLVSGSEFDPVACRYQNP